MMCVRDNRPTGAKRIPGATGGPHRGMVLIFVLVVVALLTLAGLTFSELMLVERQAAELSGRRAQSRALADSGLEMARLFLAWEEEAQIEAGGWYDNPDRFGGVLILDDEDARRRGRFTMVAPRIEAGRIEAGRFDRIRFGLEDESTRLNLNCLSLADQAADSGGRQILMGLPGMTEDVADAILDWIDTDDEPREYGAEIDYYSSLDPPYATKNGPLETIEELLLVRGVTPWLLFGADANRNGYRDRSEPDPETVAEVDNSDGSMDRGWAAYLTLYSMESNLLQPDGQPRVDLGLEDMEQLHRELEQALGNPQWATFIVAYRQNGPYKGSGEGEEAPSGKIDLSKPGKFPVKTVLDLIGPRVRVTFEGDRTPTILETPFPNEPEEMSAYLPVLMDHVTATSSTTIPGRININQASATVLAGIPGMTDQIVDEILTRRQPDPADADPQRRHETWIRSEEICTLEEMKALMPFVCAGGSVYRTQAIGYFDQGGPASRVEAVLDATIRPARVIFWRDMSHLGRGYPLETLLGTEALER